MYNSTINDYIFQIRSNFNFLFGIDNLTERRQFRNNLYRHFSKWEASSCLRQLPTAIYEHKVLKKDQNDSRSESETERSTRVVLARRYIFFCRRLYRIFAQLGDNVFAKCSSVTGISHIYMYLHILRYTDVHIYVSANLAARN